MGEPISRLATSTDQFLIDWRGKPEKPAIELHHLYRKFKELVIRKSKYELRDFSIFFHLASIIFPHFLPITLLKSLLEHFCYEIEISLVLGLWGLALKPISGVLKILELYFSAIETVCQEHIRIAGGKEGEGPARVRCLGFEIYNLPLQKGNLFQKYPASRVLEKPVLEDLAEDVAITPRQGRLIDDPQLRHPLQVVGDRPRRQAGALHEVLGRVAVLVQGKMGQHLDAFLRQTVQPVPADQRARRLPLEAGGDDRPQLVLGGIVLERAAELLHDELDEPRMAGCGLVDRAQPAGLQRGAPRDADQRLHLAGGEGPQRHLLEHIGQACERRGLLQSPAPRDHDREALRHQIVARGEIRRPRQQAPEMQEQRCPPTLLESDLDVIDEQDETESAPIGVRQLTDQARQVLCEELAQPIGADGLFLQDREHPKTLERKVFCDGLGPLEDPAVEREQ